MENLTHALYMAFAVLVFIIAFTYSLAMVNSLNNTTETLVYELDKTNFYDTLTLDYLITNNDKGYNDTDRVSKVVGIESIIPTLYRYYKESFAVRILDENGNLIQIFDATIEGDVMTAATTVPANRTAEQRALLSLYGAKKNGTNNPNNLYGATWLGSTNKDTKSRIDMYIYGGAGYINNTYVDYGQDFNNLKISSIKGTNPAKIYLNNFKDRKFKETFSQYSYEGDTLTTEDDELISVTGTKQISTKIIITYELLPE